MPSLRFPESRVSGGGYRGCEDGRPIPGQDEYKVAGNLAWAGGDFPESMVFPDIFPLVRPENEIETVRKYFPENLEKAKREFGLTRLGQYGDINAIRYVGEQSSNFQVFLICFPQGTGGGPICTGDFLWQKQQIAMKFTFPFAKRSEWRKVAEAARTLLKRWRIAALSELNNFPNNTDKGITKGAWTHE